MPHMCLGWTLSFSIIFLKSPYGSTLSHISITYHMLLNKDVLHIPESHQHWSQCRVQQTQSALSLPTTSFAVPFLCVTHSHRSMGMGHNFFVQQTQFFLKNSLQNTMAWNKNWTHSHIVKIFVDHLTLTSSIFVICFMFPYPATIDRFYTQIYVVCMHLFALETMDTYGAEECVCFPLLLPKPHRRVLPMNYETKRHTDTCWTRGLGPGHKPLHPQMIKLGRAGKSTIYTWYSHLITSIYRGFSSEPRLKDNQENIPLNLPAIINPILTYCGINNNHH